MRPAFTVVLTHARGRASMPARCAAAAPLSAMPELDHPVAPVPPGIPPGKREEPVPVLVARWMLLGCAATVAVIAVAFAFWMFVVIRGVAR